MNSNDTDRRIQEAAESILRFIDSQPNAAETAQGVLRWWMLRQRVDEGLELIQSALDYLVNKGALIKRNVGGQDLYMKAE